MSFTSLLTVWVRSGWALPWLLMLLGQTVHGQAAPPKPPGAAGCTLALTIHVTDHATDEALPGSTIRLLETSEARATDATGTCRLQVCPGSYHIEVRMMGYRTETHPVQVRAGQPQHLAVSLRAAAQELSAVQVQGQSEATTLQNSTQAVAVLDVRPYYGQSFGLAELVNRVPGVRIRQDGGLGSKAGKTRFDPTYFLNLKAATGKHCKSLYLFGNGLAFTTRIEDPTDSYEFNGPNYKYYKLDLNAKTSGSALPNLPQIYDSQSSLMRKFDDQSVLLSVSTKTENSLYQYQLSDGTVSKKMTLPGQLTGLAKLN